MINDEIQSFLKALASEKRQEIMFLFLDRKEVTVNQLQSWLELANQQLLSN
ncbi:hypothetical protein [Bacillus sp. ISL-7]|uniref:hypothetical protein n=1 Tax=Bacillus sp. ISL-7 TaxID=2819136 RepID=UPI001BEA330F|nr:hypothetical protein [Bacillus sp. ISL-7]MBT2734034.1 hypothetical protein [Bacillus sp. ISL-7]